MPREQTRGSGVLENALLLRCRDGPRAAGAPDHSAAVYHHSAANGAPRVPGASACLSFALELLFMFMELLFIIRPRAAV